MVTVDVFCRHMNQTFIDKQFLRKSSVWYFLASTLGKFLKLGLKTWLYLESVLIQGLVFNFFNNGIFCLFLTVLIRLQQNDELHFPKYV